MFCSSKPISKRRKASLGSLSCSLTRTLYPLRFCLKSTAQHLSGNLQIKASLSRFVLSLSILGKGGRFLIVLRTMVSKVTEQTCWKPETQRRPGGVPKKEKHWAGILLPPLTRIPGTAHPLGNRDTAHSSLCHVQLCKSTSCYERMFVIPVPLLSPAAEPGLRAHGLQSAAHRFLHLQASVWQLSSSRAAFSISRKVRKRGRELK